MQDLFIPLGLLLFIVLFAGAMIHTARQQKQAKSAVFKDFAAGHRLSYQQQDSGTAQRFASGFDGIGHFQSPSLGKVIPTDVVTGMISGRQMILYRHRIRFTEGWAREWFVAGVSNLTLPPFYGAIQFFHSQHEIDSVYLARPVIRQQQVDDWLLVLRADDKDMTFLDDNKLQALAALASRLDFRPEIQFQPDRLAVYIADRNLQVDKTLLSQLSDFACDSADLLSRR